MKKINLVLALIFILQTSLFAQAQTFRSNDEKAVAENVSYLRKNARHISINQAEKIAHYLAYIQLFPSKPRYKEILDRLLKSSTQFILCENINDFSCLEAAPEIQPTSDMRKDSREDLGKPLRAGRKLNIEYYFTRGWFDNFINKKEKFVIPEKTVANILAEKISQSKVKEISMAMYGIDDLDNTMSSVLEAVKGKVRDKVPVRAVVDVMDGTGPDSFIRDYDLVKNQDGTYTATNIENALDFSYINPKDPAHAVFEAPLWAEPFMKDLDENTKGMRKSEVKNLILSGQYVKIDPDLKGNQANVLKDVAWITQNKETSSINEKLTRMTYQYNGTMAFMRELNLNVQNNDEAMAHIEYPYSGIMHNKFVVFKDSRNQKSVWSGTANISETCMGSEANANMSIYVKNTAISEAFQDEFNEMFNPSKDSSRPSSLVTGKFHNKKKPNTHRYFTFDDGTHVRVHFSPTDDAEHRVIIPMLYSARTGDIVRISMFGSGGYELVRALQSAVARGVVVKIAVDSLSGAGLGSWVKSKDANLFDVNPFASLVLGSVEVRSNLWKGLNHHKTATLTRKIKNNRYRPETIVIGSQNWSGVGNDGNDENVITITNTKKALRIMLDYNQEFDERIWTASKPVNPLALPSADLGSEE